MDMRIPRVTVLVILSLVSPFTSGCGSCRKKAMPEVRDAGSVSEPEGATARPGVAAPPPAPPEAQRLAARMAVLPASYFGLDRISHTKIRASTSRMGETDPNGPDPTEIAGFEVAALDPGGREPDADRWNQELTDLYRALLDTKVFTVAKPLVIIWNAGAGQGTASWTIGVPVARGTEVRPPLSRREVPPMKVHVERGTARDILAKFGGQKEENPTVWSFIARVRRAAGPAVTHPEILMFRFPDWEVADLDDHSAMEILLGERIAAPSARPEPDAAPPPETPPAVP